MVKQERAVHTRRMILEAAAEMFDESGYDGTTIGQLIKRTGLTRGGLYFHFASKEQLAQAVLEEAATLDGVTPQAVKLQEWVDLALLLAHRLPREPLISASVRLSLDAKACALFGTRWPRWVGMGEKILTEAEERGELLPHVDPFEVARLITGAWTGIQLVTETLPDGRLTEEVSAFLQLILPNIACAGVLAKLETSPHRAERLFAQARGSAAATERCGPSRPGAGVPLA